MENYGFFRSMLGKWGPMLCRLAGSFIIAAGWNWYYLARRPHLRFVFAAMAAWFVTCALYHAGRWLFLYAVKKFQRHPFWRNEFAVSLDKIFLAFSLLFIVFFSRREWLSIVYVLGVFLILFLVVDAEFGRHPGGDVWKKVNKAIFAFAGFLFLSNSALQYVSYHYYIFDPESKYHNIVLFRSFTVSMVWLAGFAITSIVFLTVRRAWRYVAIIIWMVMFSAVMLLWAANIKSLIFAGLYFNPVALEHAEGGLGIVADRLTYFLIAAQLLGIAVAFYLIRYVYGIKQLTARYCWHYYNFTILAVGIVSIFGFSSIQNTPEFFIVKSFREYWSGGARVDLPTYIFEKLKRFGLEYNPSEFYVARKNAAYEENKKLLSDKFLTRKPNVIIIFLESFSTRFVNVYGSRFKDLTPGLSAMANNPHTTIFKKFYNASTPTITGLIAELCSFLPPTGHEEFFREKKLKRVYLSCLPRMLKDNGYQYSNYVTAVQKNFANKDSVFLGMGVDEIYGTEELSAWIQGPPLAWGYSDHQMFPAFLDIIEKRAAKPFLAMLSTVDTHPPFISAKDMLPWKNSRSNVLNSFHTTDDAFAKFWNEFRSSALYDDTVIVAVADHAVFPIAITKDIFPEEAGKVSFYDENVFMIYIPDSVLPREVDRYSSSIDFAPTLLQILGVNAPNSFEGHSIFDDRFQYPNLLGMHEFGLYINQVDKNGARKIDYAIPSQIICGSEDYQTVSSSPLTLCEFKDFYRWKRKKFEEGRFWEK